MNSGVEYYETCKILSHIYIYAGTRTPVSIEEEKEVTYQEKTLIVTVSPNPTNGQISVQYTLADSGVLRLEIYDILGQRIYNESSQKEKGTQTEQINLGNHAVSSGTYIFHFTRKTGEKTLIKSVKVQLIK
ncbi:MAG: T9SS type A sorting domain-containing protein [Ignavibacteriales bacterium]|nr:T9SS type A sorting domain-containing protein [Ignavibacteriales bacterium]